MMSCSITEALLNPVPLQQPEEKVVGGGNYVEHQALQVLAGQGFSDSFLQGLEVCYRKSWLLSCQRSSKA